MSMLSPTNGRMPTTLKKMSRQRAGAATARTSEKPFARKESAVKRMTAEIKKRACMG